MMVRSIWQMKVFFLHFEWLCKYEYILIYELYKFNGRYIIIKYNNIIIIVWLPNQIIDRIIFVIFFFSFVWYFPFLCFFFARIPSKSYILHNLFIFIFLLWFMTLYNYIILLQKFIVCFANFRKMQWYSWKCLALILDFRGDRAMCDQCHHHCSSNACW